MGTEAYKAVWDNSKQKGSIKLTLLALAEFASEQNGWTCWPTIGTIAEMIGTNERQASRNIQALEEAGEIVVTRSVGRGNANTYDLKPVICDSICDKENLSSTAAKPVTDDSNYAKENLSSMTQKPVMEGTKPVIYDTKPVIDDTPTISNHKEPEYNRDNQRELPGDLHPYSDDQMAYEEMLSAVCRVVRETYAPGLRGAEDFEGTARALIKADITPEQVLAFRDWWALPGNRHYDGRPALKSLRDNIQNSIHPIANTNGNKGAKQNEDGSYNV